MTSWRKEEIEIADGTKVLAQMPVIVSASRSTDIPAFYSDWFMERLKAGYVKWFNPFNGVPLYVESVKASLKESLAALTAEQKALMNGVFKGN